MSAQGIKKKKANWRSPCAHAHGYFCQLRKNSSPLSFLSILGRKHFSGSWRKHLDLTIYFPSFLPNQTPSKKVFLPIFFPKFSIHLVSSPNKHTLKEIKKMKRSKYMMVIIWKLQQVVFNQNLMLSWLTVSSLQNLNKAYKLTQIGLDWKLNSIITILIVLDIFLGGKHFSRKMSKWLIFPVFGCNLENNLENIFGIWFAWIVNIYIGTVVGGNSGGGGGTKEWRGMTNEGTNKWQKTFSASFGLFAIDHGLHHTKHHKMQKIFLRKYFFAETSGA